MLRHLKTLTGHQNPVYALAGTSGPDIFFTGGNDKGVVEWSLEKMTFLKVLMPVKHSVYSLQVHQEQLFAGLRSGEVMVYDFRSAAVTACFTAHPKPVFDIAAVPAKQEFLTAGEDGTVGVWSMKDYSLLYRIPVAAVTVRSIAISPDGHHAAFGCKDGSIRIYNLDDYSLLHIPGQHSLPVTALQYSPDGKYLVSGGRDAQLNFWDSTAYQLRHTIPAHLFTVYAIAFHPQLPYFATASQDKSIKLWGSDDLKLYKILSLEKGTPGHTHSVNKLIWTPDGRYLLSAGDDRQVMVWEWI